MAPEQIQSRACANSDQYSLGVVVYEWLSGTRPFQGSFAEIAVKHTLALPPSLHEKVPTLAPAIEAVVMKALAKDPKERYENIRTFAHALQQAYLQMPATTIHLGNASAPMEQPASGVETIQLSNEEENSPAALLTVPIETTALPTLSDTTVVPASSALKTPVLAEAQSLAPPVHRGISRRTVLRGLIGAAAVGAAGGGLVWLLHNQASQGLPGPAPSSSEEGRTLYTFRGHSTWVWAAAWSPDSSRIASASGDGTAQVWDALSGDHLTVFYGHSNSVYTVAWSPDGRRIASAGYDKSVQVWDATYGDHFLSYLGHSALVWSVAWAPNGKRIASAGGDKTVQVWDATNGLSPIIYRGHTGFVYRIAWSPDSKYIASASGDGTVQVWDAANGHLLYTFQSISASMLAVAWSPQGQRIASAGSDGKVQVWDAMSGNHLYIYYGHSDFVYTVAWSPDGGRIASGGDDKTVQVWNAGDGSDAYIYRGHTDSVRSVAWANNGKQITSASWDKTVQVWRA
jgi:WD40 repeat protein